jgi:hypothetical protein
MKIATIAFASIFALSSTFALAQGAGGGGAGGGGGGGAGGTDSTSAGNPSAPRAGSTSTGTGTKMGTKADPSGKKTTGTMSPHSGSTTK